MSGTAVIFPGQGSQQAGMGADVYERSPKGRAVFDRACDVLGFDLKRACFEGPADKLECTDIQQPAILVTSLAIWEAMREAGKTVEPQAVAGLSLGEYTALHVAGSLDFEDAVRLVHRRGRLMQEAAERTASGMVSVVGGDERLVRELCAEAAEGEALTPANFNCPGQIVISGTAGACRRAVELAGQKGLRCLPLKVAGAFHSSLMQPAADQLAEALRLAPVRRPRIPVVANVDAQYHDSPEGIRRSLFEQVTHPVRWQASMELLLSQGINRFVEVGPGRVLTGLMKKIDRKADIAAVNGMDAIGAFAEAT